MLCRIADLTVEIPAAGGLSSRCSGYRCEETNQADFAIREELYDAERYLPAKLSGDELAYMESAYQFCFELLRHDGMYLHASAVALDGYGYLFSGHCGAGKSTHTQLWKKTFGEAAVVFNDDKPALRRMNGRWIAYGTPWCGKSGINANMSVPLAGICFIEQAKENRIRRLTPSESVARLLSQTIRRRLNAEEMDRMLETFGKLIEEIPVFVLECNVEKEAALLSHETMRRAAKEASL